MTFENPEDILKSARSFMESRILLTGAELNLFTLLAHRNLTDVEIAEQTGTALRPLSVLLNALTALGVLVKEDNRYRCAPPASSFLTDGAAGTVLPMVLHMAHLWHRWSELTDLLRDERIPESRPHHFDEAAELKAFIGAMHVIAKSRADEIAAEVHAETAEALLDVGGASGTYTMAFLRVNSRMRATLFDRDEVMEMARERLDQEGLLHRVALIPGDFYRDEFPPGHDLAWVSAIIHQNSPEQNLDLYRKVFRSLIPGGRIVIRDHVMESDRTKPLEGAVFAVNMLVATEGGGTYTFDEIRDGLIRAGFSRINFIRQGEHMDSLIEAFKP